MSGTSCSFKPVSPHLPESLSDAARERVVARLTRLYAQDELTEQAFEEQLQRVYAATSLQQLDVITASLPAIPEETTPVRKSEQGGAQIAALFSGQERKIVTTVPRELKLRARLGYVELDLTHATFEPGLTTIDARAFMGYVRIRFPAGVNVESAGHALFGLFTIKGPAGSTPEVAHPRSVVRITGRAIFGLTESFVGIEPDEDE